MISPVAFLAIWLTGAISGAGGGFILYAYLASNSR